MSGRAGWLPPCTAPYCDRQAVTAVHNHGTSVLIRPDHAAESQAEMFGMDWRCLQHALDDVETAIARHADRMARRP